MSENTVQTTSQDELSIIQSERRSILQTGNILISLIPENRNKVPLRNKIQRIGFYVNYFRFDTRFIAMFGSSTYY